ncbi:hypothetical protein NESM_000207900 [Novymonas esmeraldas]|uniref:Exosome-associated protein 3 n=1 Tax=Novymonas esmeraldas TaxID=1808958 RepID=A0AAW0F6L8_9TRYP
MDVDADVAPLLREMAERLSTVRADLLPALRQLDEEALLSHYCVDEQARLYLSAAFTLALSLYSLDKLVHRQVSHRGAAGSRLPGSTAATTTTTTTTTASSSSTSGAATDTQLVLKLERIAEYIKKLQEIASLEKQRRRAGATITTTNTATAAVGMKRPREESVATAAAATAPTSVESVRTAATGSDVAATAAKEEDEEDYGDVEMFRVVSRVAGETGTLVSRLLRQVMAPSSSPAGTEA